MRRRYSTLGFSAMLVMGAACSSAEPFEATPMPDVARDAAVTDLLPIGPHTMDLKFTMDGAAGKTSTLVSGYIDLSEDYDLHGSCSYDLQATEFTNDGSTTAHVFKKTPGGQAWRQVETSDLTGVAPLAGEWFAGDDPDGWAPPIFFPMLFLNKFYAGGGDYWCNMRRIDQVTVLADKTTGRLGWVPTEFGQVYTANAEAWYLGYLDAAGVSGPERDELASEFREFAVGYYTYIVENSEMEITGDAEGRRLTVYYRSGDERKPVVEIAFAPTEERQVDDVVGAKTYFEKVADGDVEFLPLWFVG